MGKIFVAINRKSMVCLSIILSKQGFMVQIGWWALILFLIFLFLLYLFNKKSFRKYSFGEFEISLGGIKYKIKPSYEDIQVAYKLWVEISTRKLGNRIDTKNDLILKLQKSYYEFFKIARNILKGVPAEKITNKETQKIINLVLYILNENIRPYLTKWHAEFENWYKINSNKYKNLSPLEIERKFPKYRELMKDLLELNEEIIKLKDSLGQLIEIKK